jgi:hypothetical protein
MSNPHPSDHFDNDYFFSMNLSCCTAVVTRCLTALDQSNSRRPVEELSIHSFVSMNTDDVNQSINPSSLSQTVLSSLELSNSIRCSSSVPWPLSHDE